MRRRLLGMLLALVVVGALPALADSPYEEREQEGPPVPNPAFVSEVPGKPCTVENRYEAAIYGMEVGEQRYPGICKRIRFAFGPIQVKPGENDAILQPVTIEKPSYDGFVTRFKPDLVINVTGDHPRTDTMHLHHATWLNGGNSYGSGPFFAAGEEKTIMTLPEGYGMAVKGSDVWLLLYMVHNAGTQTETVWLTYDIDYVATADGVAAGMAPVKPIWLDVQKNRVHPEAPSTSSNPVFNVHKGFGSIDPETGRRVCVWPKENCARYGTYGDPSPNQGQTVDRNGNPIVIPGQDWTVPSNLSGTLIGLGGHLHPGGIRDEVSLVRNGVEKPIFLSDAVYWDFEDPSKPGGPPHSWNMSMTVQGAPDWKVKIRPGDVLRLNAVVDSEDASWYEGMGIVVAYVATEDPHLPAGVDVFDDDVILDRGLTTRALMPEGPYDPKSGFRPHRCTPDLTGAIKRLCLRGPVTHGAYAESGFAGGCPQGGCAPLPDKKGRVVSEIVSAGFTYGEADMGVIGALGIPQVKVDQPVRLWNYDSAARVWHTYTRCAEPCTGQTGVAYPLADGGNGSPDDVMDFDSSEIGFGTPWEPASGQIGGYKSPEEVVRDSFYTDFVPNRTGTYAFWCRIHPGMRGAFEVVE